VLTFCFLCNLHRSENIMHYNTICLSTAVLAAESGGFGRCFTQPRPLVKPAPPPARVLSLLNQWIGPPKNSYPSSSISLTYRAIPNPKSRCPRWPPFSRRSWRTLPGCALTAMLCLDGYPRCLSTHSLLPPPCNRQIYF
jgi:hypothetical protein